MPANHQIRTIAAMGCFVALASAVACGSSSSGGTGDSGTRSSTTAPAPNSLAVEISDGAIHVTGTPRPGRIDVTVTNHTAHAAEFSFQPMKPGVTVEQLLNAIKTKGEEAASTLLAGDSDKGGYGEPAIVGAHSSTEVITTQAVPAGQYAGASFLPGSDGMPQALDGLATGFEVSGAPYVAVPADVAGTISLADDSITLPAGFTGSGTYAVTDTGHAPHSLSFGSLRGPLSALFGCVGQSFGKGQPIDSCPGTLLGGIDTIKPGDTAYVVLALRPGKYGYVSTDGNDFQQGLNGTVTLS